MAHAARKTFQKSASTGHGASSAANFADNVGLNIEGDVPVTSAGTI